MPTSDRATVFRSTNPRTAGWFSGSRRTSVTRSRRSSETRPGSMKHGITIHLVASQLAMTGQQGSGSGQGLVGGRSPVPLENHPNPFRSGTTIEFELSAGAMVRLEVFDAQGRRVARLADSYLLPGPHRVAWDQRVASGLLAAPGVYIYRLTAGAFHDQRQMVLLQ